MKKILKLSIFTAVLALSFATANAQSQFTTNEVRQFMSKGEQNGIEIMQ